MSSGEPRNPPTRSSPQVKPTPELVASRARESKEQSEAAAASQSTSPPPKPHGISSDARIPFFASAAQAEIVRANQKDLYYLSQLTERIEDVSRGLLGTRWLQAWGKELNQGSRIAYFALTTLLGSQTLGEEYCDIMQYDVRTRKPPTIKRRATLVSLHIIVPYVLSRLYSNLRRMMILRHEAHEQERLRDASLDSLFSSSSTPPPKIRSNLLKRTLDRLSKLAPDLPTFETLTEDYLRSVHLAIFYLWGRYYNLSKRAAGIRFISMQARRSLSAPASAAISPPSSYEVLGVLMGVQILVRTGLAVRRRRMASIPDTVGEHSNGSPQESQGAASHLKSTNSTTAAHQPKKKTFTVDGLPLSTLIFDPDDPEQASPYPEDEEGAEARDRRCTLCLGARRDPSATECGHVFCWECIVGWAREKAECPLCRQSVNLSKLLPVYNI